MIIGNIIATGVSAIAIIILSRLLGPTLFGEFSVGFSLILILTRINDLGLSSAIQKYAGETTNDKLQNIYFSIALRIKLITSFLIIVFGLVFYSSLAHLFHLNNENIILLSFVFGLSSVYLEQLSAMLLAIQKINQVVIANFLQAFTKLITALFLFFTNKIDVTIAFGLYAIAPIIPVFFSKKLLPVNIKISMNLSSSEAKEKLYSMAKHTGLAGITTALVSQVSVLFTQFYLTSFDTGILGGVSKIQMLFSLIAVSLGNVLFPRVSRYKNKNDLITYIKKAFLIVLLSIVGFIFTIFISKLLINISIGNEYLSGLNVLYILLGATFITIATVPFTALFYSFNINIFFSILGLLQAILIIIGNIFLIPNFGLIGTAYAQLITRLIIFIITILWSLVIAKRKINFYINNNL